MLLRALEFFLMASGNNDRRIWTAIDAYHIFRNVSHR